MLVGEGASKPGRAGLALVALAIVAGADAENAANKVTFHSRPLCDLDTRPHVAFVSKE